MVAPDVLIALDRPAGHRHSYRQWEEDNIAPQIVWEIMSQSNTRLEMTHKKELYEQFGVREYYLYDPLTDAVEGYRRDDRSATLEPITPMHGFISPLLGIEFDTRSGPELVIYRPDGKRFKTWEELRGECNAAVTAWESERNRASIAEIRFTEQGRAIRAAAAETERAERLAAQLRALGIKPDDIV